MINSVITMNKTTANTPPRAKLKPSPGPRRVTFGPADKSFATRWWVLLLAFAAVIALAGVSLFVGAAPLSVSDLLNGDKAAEEVFWISRVPRTVAALLAGAAVAISGLIMQQLARNRFVEPNMVGSTESAMLGILAVTIFVPAMPVIGKMGVATVFSLVGTALFLAIINNLPTRATLLIPLVGLMLGGVVSAAATFVAYRNDLLQTLNAWMIGDLSGIIQGRYELLWIVAVVGLVGYIAADRFTAAGLGSDFCTSIGMNYRVTVRLGMAVVALISAVTVTTVGALPFLGLVVPNLVSVLVGDHLRRAVPWTALIGAGMVLACDIAGRLIRIPYEVPVGMIMSVLGSIVFLSMIIHQRYQNVPPSSKKRARQAAKKAAAMRKSAAQEAAHG